MWTQEKNKCYCRLCKHTAQIPLRRGVCTTRTPAPTPTCFGVAGTLTLAGVARAIISSFALLARCQHNLSLDDCFDLLFSLPGNLPFYFSLLRVFSIGFRPVTSVVEALFLHRIKHRS